MLKNLRRSLFQDGTEVLARKVGSHHERLFRPWLRVASAAGSPQGAFKERSAMPIGSCKRRHWQYRSEMCRGQWRWTDANSVLNGKWTGLADRDGVQEKGFGMSSGFLARTAGRRVVRPFAKVELTEEGMGQFSLRCL